MEFGGWNGMPPAASFPANKTCGKRCLGRAAFRMQGVWYLTDETMFARTRLRRRGKTQNLLPIL